jgi:insertion element IS1 protein InsB
LLERLKRLEVVLLFTDNWEAYAELIPAEMLIQTKAETHGIERNNFRQRHWFGRFRRKTCIVSRSLKMVDLTSRCLDNHYLCNTLVIFKGGRVSFVKEKTPVITGVLVMKGG